MRTLLSFLLVASTVIASAQAPQAKPSLQSLKAAAEAGSAEAQLAYAKALNPKPEARVWAQKAADQGLGEAWFWLGYTMTGDTRPYYEKAAEKGYAPAFDYLLDALLFRAAEKADVVKAKRFADIARATNIDLGSRSREILDTIDRCFDAGASVIPPADKPTKAEAAALSDCTRPTDGPASPQDLVTYRKCILAEDPLDNNRVAEVYANGWGVKRNPKLAIALVCHASEVPAELFGMVETLWDGRTLDKLDEPFLFCSHVTSGMNQGRCAAESEGLAEAAREKAIAALIAGWPEAHVAKFKALQKAADQFFSTRSGAEVDMSGTARAALALAEEGQLREDFLAAIREFESGKLPASVPLAKADAELNAVYGRIMKTADLEYGTVTKDTIRETQRVWLPYRDAWAAFGAARYPRVTSDAWKAWATGIRTTQLKEFLAQ